MSNGHSDPEKEHTARIAEAQRVHDRADKGLIALFPATMSFAVEALKAPALINGGSAAAMLAFIGTGRQPVTADTIIGLRLFGAGLLVSALATGVSWIAQHYYLRSMDEGVRTYEPPYFAKREGMHSAGGIFRLLAVVLVVGAYGLAGYGMWYVSSGLVPLPAR